MYLPQRKKQPNKNSQYRPIWMRLKANGTCTLVAPQQYHARIIKAVKKQRDQDTEFLYMLSEAGKKHKITFEITGNTVTLFLTLRYSIYGI